MNPRDARGNSNSVCTPWSRGELRDLATGSRHWESSSSSASTGALGKAVGRPRTRVSPDQVVALRARGLSYRAVARHLHISPALAHRLAQDTPLAGPPGRSASPPTNFETDRQPSVFGEAPEGHRASGMGDERTP